MPVPRTVFAAILVLAATPPAPATAQDRRAVVEPVLPRTVCATLTSDATLSPADQTRRLQAAIDRCPPGAAVRLVATGGGAARFVTGPLVIKSGVTLWLDRNVVLAAVPDPRAYDRGGGLCGRIAAKGGGCRPFLSFDGTRGGGVVGDGTIDGQGGAAMVGRDESWWQLASRAQREGGDQNVPRLIQAAHARDLTLYRVTLRDAPNFHVALDDVAGATIWGIVIDTPADARNTDGIDPGASRDVTIAHSVIRTGDDDIALKAGKGATHHVSIVDDRVYSGHGVSIGSETTAGVSDVLVRDVTLDGTTSGLRIKSDASRGGLVSRIRYERVCLRGNRRPIDFDTRYDASKTGLAIPVYRDVTLHAVRGGTGDLVVRGHDAGHPLAVMLADVRFAPGAIWVVENARLTAGAGGVSPPPPGLAGAGVTIGGDDCAARWRPFDDPVR